MRQGRRARRHPRAQTAWDVAACQATRLRCLDPLAQRRVALIDKIGVPGWGETEAEAEAEAWAEAEAGAEGKTCVGCLRWGCRVRVDVPHECGGVVRLQLEERRGVERSPQPRLLYHHLHRRALGQLHRRRPSGCASSGHRAACAATAASPPRAGANGLAGLTGGGGGGGGECGWGGGGARPPRALLGRSPQRLQRGGAGRGAVSEHCVRRSYCREVVRRVQGGYREGAGRCRSTCD